MKGFHIEGDPARLDFTNYDLRSDEEEFNEIMSILKKHNMKQLDYIMGPDCDMYECIIDNVKFSFIHTIDGEGSFLYCDDKAGMLFLETLFDMM